MSASAVEYSTRYLVDLIEKKEIQILHVDNDAVFLNAVRQRFLMYGIAQVDAASSVEEAMKKMRKKTYDAVVSECALPGKDGLQFLKELRQQGDDIPFVILTGKSTQEVAIKALNLGANHYFTKNEKPELMYAELARSINKAVEKARTKETIRDSEQNYRRLIDETFVAVCRTDEEGQLVHVNKAWEKLTGYSVSETIGHSLEDFIRPDDRGEITQRFLKPILSQMETQHFSSRVVCKDGRLVPVAVKATRFTAHGQPAGIQAFLIEASEGKEK